MGAGSLQDACVGMPVWHVRGFKLMQTMYRRSLLQLAVPLPHLAVPLPVAAATIQHSILYTAQHSIQSTAQRYTPAQQ
jgi:hypothetical protein